MPKNASPPVFVTWAKIPEVVAPPTRKGCVLATFVSKITPAETVRFPLALNVVNAPVLGVVAPMAVEFRPVEVKVPTTVPEPTSNTIGRDAVPVPTA